MAPPVNPNFNPHSGVTDPHNINNLMLFVLFGLLGAGFVLCAVWFFFWARNGGFHFNKTDWDDYKTTVLRRRGPNGTLLSNATASTKLGGGSSIYKDYLEHLPPPSSRSAARPTTGRADDDDAMSGITAGASDLAARAHRDARRSRRNAAPAAGGAAPPDHRVARDHLRSYRHEKPARVGGLNRESDATTWAGSNSSATGTTAPTSSSRGTSVPGIRKVQPSERRQRHRHHYRRHRTNDPDDDDDDSDSAAPVVPARRDFSFHRGDAALERMLEPPSPSSPAPPPSYDNATGTKSYHHPMPELSAADSRLN